MIDEKRLIDAKLAQHIADVELTPEEAGVVQWVLSHTPTVDAVEVVHGRCEYCKDGKSFIGARMLLGNDGKWHDINNCPNCGAKMNGGTI